MDRVGERAFPVILDEQAALHGDRTFLVHEDLEGVVTSFSFTEMRERAQACAGALQSVGLEKGGRVFVFLRNTADFVPLWFGVMLAGGVVVPGNIYLTAPEVEHLTTVAEPSVIITESQFLPLIREVVERSGCRTAIVSTDGGADCIELATLVERSPDFTPVSLSSDDLAEILFTSGTSSRPKGVMLTHANLIWCGIAGVANTSLSPADRSFNNKPLFHVNCQETVLSCLMAGATAIVGERYSASRYINQLIRHGATICSLSGMLCRTLLKQPSSPLDRSHQIRFAGYGINISEQEIAEFSQRFGMRIRNGYGQSEAMVYISVESVTSPTTYPSIGRPGLGREVFIVDDQNRILPPLQLGEIVLRGRPGRDVMLGYYKDEAATKAAFEGGFLHTNDLGWFDEMGNLYFQGRRGDMIKRAGENISAQEVEDALIGHEAVKDVAVIGVPDPVRDQAVKAFVVLRAGSRPTSDELREFCRERLAYFKVPEFIVFVAELPRNASGKVLKRELDSLPPVEFAPELAKR
ncbi:ATP-dependent acyl-CoA ligase [Pseudaminobacter arsenicus]|uniref:3-methylmercaptopropionyl-CoA ligase n=1 Tax=Borborobacter arsenicus TaxID=1851146 RepID=A0A432V7X5_9HYPH|nr:AMP-binding protein [Pseudaminobacter arsenicus]RUM98274.1 ATP-dependent acyl-CoA ligase [Pseudaminobacter arsenicus]